MSELADLVGADEGEGNFIEQATPSPTPRAPQGAAALSRLGGIDVQRVHDVLFNFNMMIYGPPGVGKTVLCGSAAEVIEMSPVLFVDVEGGTLSVSAQGFDCDVVRVTTWQQ